MQVIDLLNNILTGIQLGLAGIQLQMFIYLIEGGWVTILRSIGFFIDKYLVIFISKAFEYFLKIISNDLIIPTTVNNITKNIYFFIAAILFFKLAVRLLKYIVNPNLTSDENVGGNALIRRTIVGMILIISIPSIFSLARELQSAIIEDDIISKVIMDKYTLKKYNDLKTKAPVGRIIGFSVLQGFINYNGGIGVSSSTEKQWSNAKTYFDPSAIKNINAGGLGYIDNYYFDYFPILSTVALGYTLYLIVKFCFDVLIRSLKLTVLQVISPIVVLDYIMDGDREGSFKTWLHTTVSTFLMLFMRVVSLWFIIFVAIQMQMTSSECVTNLTAQGIDAEQASLECGASILYLDSSGNVDMLLRAAIIIALLAFAMDLPKLIGKIFNLDLEQESSVTGMLSKIGGVGKMVGLGGLAFAGGMLGGAIGGIKSGVRGLSENAATKSMNKSKLAHASADRTSALNDLNNSGLDKNSLEYKNRKDAIENKFNAEKSKIDHDNKRANQKFASQMSGATRGMAFGGIAAALGKTSVGGAFTGGYSSGQNGAQSKAKESGDNFDALNLSETKVAEYEKQMAQQAEETRYKEHQMATAEAAYNQQQAIAYQQQAMASQLDFQATMDLAARIKTANPTITDLPTAIVDVQMNANTADISAQRTAMSNAITAAAGGSGTAPISSGQAVQIVTEQLQNSGVSNTAVSKVVNYVQSEYNSGRSINATNADQLVNDAYDAYREELKPNAEKASKLVP